MDSTQDRQIAVFIDFENLAIGAEDDLPGMGRRAVPYRALDHLCQGRGTATVRRAYADWAKPRFGKYQEDLGLNGVDLIQVARFGGAQKNAADIRMAVDAMETLISHPDIAEYILVAGDGDYSPLVQRLREFGKAVVGVGTQATASARLVSVCTEYKYWGTLVADVDPTATTATTAVAAAFDIHDAVDLLVRAMTLLGETSVSPDDEGWLFAGEVKNIMLRLDPSFDQSNYRVRNFSAFLEISPVRRAVEIRRTGLKVDLRLLSRGADNGTPITPAPVPAADPYPAEPAPLGLGSGATQEGSVPAARSAISAQTTAEGVPLPVAPPSDGQRALRKATWALPSLDEQEHLLGGVFDRWSTNTGSLDDAIAPVTSRLASSRHRVALQFVLVNGGLLCLEPQDPTAGQAATLRAALVRPYDGTARASFVLRGLLIWMARALVLCDVAGLPEQVALADPVFDGCRDDARLESARHLMALVDEELCRQPGEPCAMRDWFSVAREAIARLPASGVSS